MGLGNASQSILYINLLVAIHRSVVFIRRLVRSDSLLPLPCVSLLTLNFQGRKQGRCGTVFQAAWIFVPRDVHAHWILRGNIVWKYLIYYM